MIKTLFIGLLALAAPKYHYGDQVSVDNKHHKYTDEEVFHKCDMYSIGRVTAFEKDKYGNYEYAINMQDNIYCDIWFKGNEIETK